MAAAEYEVYSAALNEIHADMQTDTFYVNPLTVGVLTIGPRKGVARWLASMPDVTQDMIDSYVNRNSESLQLSPERFTTLRPVVLTDSIQGATTITLSRVGFNVDMTEAVVHTIDRCGVRCGGGFIMRFSRVEGQWIVREGMDTFIM